MAAVDIKSKQKSIGLGAVLIAVLLIFILTLAPPDTPTTANIQPELLALAAEQPETAVRVIIQKSAADVNLTDAVTHLGGRIVQN